ncbi:MAG: hypothetical protein BXU00_03005 [Candidatus Nanoclepta minutus]|uniref:Uncharacterized protein n=1 Tax=Candidatus Nanoclepta minutus TaxID=1940235 RepID=A0A397WMK3_9ARCH|nr:MAG: hypothetical protein BXU00_03005 [Candidatus Nanoclepta minutus]
MRNSRDLVKNFEAFCKYVGGNFNQDIFPRCSKLSFSIVLEFVESEEYFEKLSIKIESTSGDYEVLKLENVKILDIERFSEEGARGSFEYYTLRISTDKGTIFLRRSIREDKLIISYKGEGISYESSIVF